MFWSLFASKNQKLVNGWVKEHSRIVTLAHKVIDTYSKDNLRDTRKALSELNSVALMHLMTEDIEFYRLLKDKTRADEQTQRLVNEFTTSFRDTKMVLRDFLLTYTKEDAVLNDEFFTTFKSIVDVLAKRIVFEEEHVYKILAAK